MRLTVILHIFVITVAACLASLIPVTADESINIVIVKSAEAAPYDAVSASFKKHLVDSSHEVVIHEIVLGSNAEDTARETAGLNPYLILAIGSPAAMLVRDRIPDGRMVFALVMTPEANGINSPGVSMDIHPRIKFDTLKKLFPPDMRYGTIYTDSSRHHYQTLTEEILAAGATLEGRKIDTREDFPRAFRKLAAKIDAFVMIPDATLYFTESVVYLLKESLRNRVPVIGLSSRYTKAGALISFDFNYEDIGLQAGEITEDLLLNKEDSPRSIEAPRRVMISLNMRVADIMDINIPREIIEEADEVIER